MIMSAGVYIDDIIGDYYWKRYRGILLMTSSKDIKEEKKWFFFVHLQGSAKNLKEEDFLLTDFVSDASQN